MAFQNFAALAFKVAWNMALIVSYPCCISIYLVLLVSMLILLSICINSRSYICIGNILVKLHILRGNTLILARIISSENTNQAAIWFVSKALILYYLGLIHALILWIEIPALSRSKYKGFFVEVCQPIGIIDQYLVSFAYLIRPVSLSLGTLAAPVAGWRTYWYEWIIRLQVTQIHCFWSLLGDFFWIRVRFFIIVVDRLVKDSRSSETHIVCSHSPVWEWSFVDTT